MLPKRELKRYKISIAAIIKDEFDYIEEWIAYHKLLGFEHFYIADNGSTDGTSEYLQALEQVGLVTRIFQADGAKIQLDAYNKILRKYGHETELLLFIDCDEFVNLTKYTKRYSKEIESLVSLFKDPLVGAVALNWRVFGSSGLEKKSDGLVTERFTYSSKEQHKKNRYFKTVVRPSHVEYMRVHHAHLVQGSKFLNTEGKPLQFQDNQINGISQTFCNEITVNHYIIKSLDEFIAKKQKRGDAMVGKHHEKSISYFHTNDLNDIENISLVYYSKKIQSSINKIKKAMASKSDYNKTLVGYIDTYNDKLLRGWVRYQGSHKSKAIKLAIRENNRETLLTVNCFRKDLFIENKHDGCDGFHHLFEQPLKSRENQRIRVYANNFIFPRNKKDENSIKEV